MDINDIQKILPHRYPFLLIDKIIDYEPDLSAHAIKCVTINEPFFQGHFPQKAVMPGMLIIEALAQSAAIMVSELLKESELDDPIFYLAGIDKVKFRKIVTPGDQLTLDVELIKRRSLYLRCQSVARVGSEIACEAEILSIAQ